VKGNAVALPRVLVIDDDPAIQNLLRSVLEEEGYQVLSAASTVHPVDVSQLHPALIILDVWLDGDDSGWGLPEELKVTPGARQIPVMLCTGDGGLLTREANRIDALAAGILRKPFDLDDVVARVAACVPAAPRSGSSPGSWHGLEETRDAGAP
jgi:DNA-binding response OmpR family regulator